MPVKRDIREYAREYRNNNKNKANENRIIQNFLNSAIYKSAKTIFCYASLDGEISTDEIIKTAFKDNKRVAAPRCIDKNGNMQFFYINSLSDLKISTFGVREPKYDNTNLALPNKNTVIIVPAMAFNKYGYRVGYGKGYYDRYLKNCLAVSVGLCYNDLVIDIEDINKYDINVNYLVTETNLTELSLG